MKFIDMCSHFHWGTGNGCNNPGGFWCFALICYQVRHCDTYIATFRFIPSHQNFFSNLWTSLCLQDEESFVICVLRPIYIFLSCSTISTQSLPLHLHAPSKSILHISGSLVTICENHIWNPLSFFCASKIRLMIIGFTTRHPKCLPSSESKGYKSNFAIVSNNCHALIIREEMKL